MFNAALTAGGCSSSSCSQRGGGRRPSCSADRHTHAGVPGPGHAGSPLSPGRGSNMLTDTMMEEEFEKNVESWHHPQDLEHGKSRGARPVHHCTQAAEESMSSSSPPPSSSLSSSCVETCFIALELVSEGIHDTTTNGLTNNTQSPATHTRVMLLWTFLASFSFSDHQKKSCNNFYQLVM